MSLRFQEFPLYNELRRFNTEIYHLSHSFPQSENFELSSQLRRASTSVILNLAEGSMRKSDKELARFLLICTGSLGEIVSILDICLDLKYIAPSTHEKYVLKCESLLKKLYGFRKSLL